VVEREARYHRLTIKKDRHHGRGAGAFSRVAQSKRSVFIDAAMKSDSSSPGVMFKARDSFRMMVRLGTCYPTFDERGVLRVDVQVRVALCPALIDRVNEPHVQFQHRSDTDGDTGSEARLRAHR
jgi:hypothetical protein